MKTISELLAQGHKPLKGSIWPNNRKNRVKSKNITRNIPTTRKWACGDEGEREGREKTERLDRVSEKIVIARNNYCTTNTYYRSRPQVEITGAWRISHFDLMKRNNSSKPILPTPLRYCCRPTPTSVKKELWKHVDVSHQTWTTSSTHWPKLQLPHPSGEFPTSDRSGKRVTHQLYYYPCYLVKLFARC